MATKLELLQEAERRGILPPDKISLLREAERRGLTTNTTQDTTTQVGAIEAGIVGAGQGVSAGYSDEIVAGLSSPFIYGMSRLIEGLGYDTKGLANKTIGEIYQDEIAKSRSEIQQAKEDQPGAFLGGEIAGSIVGAGKVAKGAKSAGIALPSLRTGNLAQRVGKSAAVGASSAGLYGTGTADSDRLKSGAESAISGATFGALLPVVGKALQSKPIIKTAEEVKDMASKAYSKATSAGGVLKPTFVNKFIENAKKVQPQTKAGKLIAGENEVSKLTSRLDSLKGKSLSLDEAQEVDEIFGDLIDSQIRDGRLTKEGKKIMDIQNNFRTMIEKAPESEVAGSKVGFESLKEARKLWSKTMKINDIQRIIQRAEMMDNPATGIKTGFRTLANNPKRMRGFTKKERDLINKAAKSGLATDGLRVLGSRLIPIGSLVSGSGASGVAAAQIGSKLSRDAATKIQQQKAMKIINEILSDMPAQTQQMPLKYTNPSAMAPILGGNNGS
jgi:hypothetical protein